MTLKLTKELEYAVTELNDEQKQAVNKILNNALKNYLENEHVSQILLENEKQIKDGTAIYHNGEELIKELGLRD